MLSCGRISWESVQRYQALFFRFQRVRWRTAAAALKDIDTILGFCARQEEECRRRAYA
jgi:hypothetical protein